MVDVRSALHPHVRLGLDTSVFIYHIEATSPFSSVASDVLQLVRQHSATGVTSILTLAELLVKPLQLRRLGLAARYEALLRGTPHLTVMDIDARVARRAARLRATHQIRVADAIQMAAALEHGATVFITNDFRLRRVDEIAVVVLADLVES